MAAIAAVWIGGTSAVLAEETSVEKLRFNRDIRPILSDKCYACHGPDEADRQADLRLDDEADARRDRGGYAVLVPGEPDASALIQRITSTDPDARMPPADSGKELSPDEIDRLQRWVEQGAPYARHWAYLPPVRSPIPVISNPEWSRNPIDRFLHAGLEARGLAPSAPADTTTLVRRIYFDLIGLPPTPEQVQQVLADPSPDAIERLVDRLLASPHFGERMASYWFDLVRYANTVGYHGDQEHAIAPYRDWVIAAFNQNMPFDQFTREQLAGDLLAEPTLDQRIATGFNRVHQMSHEGGVQVKEYLAKYSADRVRNFGSVWLGSTVACAECHNHKFDPFTQRDFYSLAAFFADIDDLRTFKASDVSPTKREPEIIVPPDEHRSELATLKARLWEFEAELAAVGTANDLILQQQGAAKERIAAIEAAGRRTMITETTEPRPIRVLARGDWMDESGPIVAPATPAFLPSLDIGERRATRLDLANWLFLPQHPLTARVVVNRYWYLLFGNGLSPSLEDFGNQGDEPAYPELLDYLSIELRESGWNIKALVRSIVTSEAYRQSAYASESLRELDPTNRLFARQSLYRLSAEMVRDNMLSVSGLLVPEVGGASSHPFQPEGYYDFLNFPKRTYRADADGQQYRRAVYVHWQRQFLHPMFKAFDAPTREECTVRRPVTNTPLAALTMLNDPSFVEGARALAIAAIKHAEPQPEERIAWMWQRVLTRTVEKNELAALKELYESDRAVFEENPTAADQLLAIGLVEVPIDVPRAELAALTSVARALLNLHETITRR